MSSNEMISDSQASNVSSLGLGLSQETMNQVMGAVGLSSATGDRLLEEFHAEIQEDEDGEEGIKEETNTTLDGSSTISISRAVFIANSQVSSDSSGSQFLLSSPPHPHSAPSMDHTPTTSGHTSWTSGCPGGNSVSPSFLSSPTPPPTAHIENMHLTTSPLHHLPPSSSSSSQPLIPPFPSASQIPQNIPFPGAYNFVLSVSPSVSSSKTPNVIYSTEAQRMYIKKDATVPITFITNGSLPPSAFITATAIHKLPEMIGEILHCCAKHVDEMRKKGLLYPFHFIRSPMDNSSYYGDPTQQRLSVSIPVTSLQKAGDTQYTALYQFPCFTSDFQRAGQLVQLIFTLECDGHVYGRATLDVRVCASPGRDRSVEERKTRTRSLSSSVTEEVPPERRKGRKRAATVTEEVTQCTLPPKRVCRITAERKEFTIKTFPELFQHVHECIKLLESVYMIPVGGVNHEPPPPRLTQQDSFPSLERWLEGLCLSHHLSLFTRQGVRDMFQVMSLTDNELRSWGVSERDRRTLLDGAAALQERPSLPPTLTSSQSQLSQGSVGATQPFQGHIEVLQIQARKTVKTPHANSN